MTDILHSMLLEPKRPIEYIKPETHITECINKMTVLDIGALVVINHQNQLIGLVSERDIVRRCLDKGFSLTQTKVSDVMYTDVSVLNVNDPIEKAMQIITQTKRRHILISDQEQFIAIISIGDLLFYMLNLKNNIIDHLQRYISS